MPVPSNIELVDRADQKKGRYHFEEFQTGQQHETRGNKNNGRGELFLKVNDNDDDMSVSNFSTKMQGEEDYYMGVDVEMYMRKKKRNRIVLVVVLILLAAIVGSAFVYKKQNAPNKSAPKKPTVGTNNNHPPSSPSHPTSHATPAPSSSSSQPPVTLWPTASPLDAFEMCAPPIVPRDKVQKKYDVFHMMNLVIVPEAPSDDDDFEDWEYTFSAMDINNDCSLISVGMSDFSAGTNYSVGLVRAFGYDCDGKEWKQVGQDLLGTNEEEQFGHRISSSSDGTVMAIAAPQESYDGGNGFVEVYVLDTKTHRWALLGQRISELAYENYDYYYMLGHAIDLSSKGETLSVLAWTNTTSFVVRVFNYDYNRKKWMRKGSDIQSTMQYANGYDYEPQLKLSQDGDELSIADPQFGILLYHFDFYTDNWNKQTTKSTTFSNETSDVYWIESIDMDDVGNLVAFSAFQESGPDWSNFSSVVKVVDYTGNTDGTDVFQKAFPDFQVSVAVDVSNNGEVASIVASKEDYDGDYAWIGDAECVGSMTVVTKSSDDGDKWRIVGENTKAANIGVPGNFVSLSGDGKIAVVGSESVVAFYGIKLKDNDENGSDSSSPSSGTSVTMNATFFSICAPFPNATLNQHAGDLDKLPREQKEHTLSLSMSKDGSVVAVGIDETDDENLGMVRVFGWNCNTQAYTQLGQDLFGSAEFDGFGQSVDLSSDGMVLVVGANQPPPGKSGYVEIYKFSDGLWNLLGKRLDQMRDLVEDIGRQVCISDDGSTVLLAGSIVEELDDGWHDTGSFLRVVEYVDDSWQAKGSDLVASIAYDDYGINVRVSLAGDGQSLVVTGSYSSFLAKVYEYDGISQNWTEFVVPPIKINKDEDNSDNTDDEYYDDGYYDWDYLYENYFTGSDVSISQNGTFLAIAGTLMTEDADMAVVRVLTKDVTTGNYSMSRDPMDFTDDYVPSSVGISADGQELAVGINVHAGSYISKDSGALFVATLANSTDYARVGQIDGRHRDDLLGSRVCISRDGTLAAASSRKGYVSFFKVG